MKQNTLRYIARFLVEADTPLAVGSGEKGLTIDRLIVKDANGLPFIPGTSLAGVIRHELERLQEKATIEALFGYQHTKERIEKIAEEQGIEKDQVQTGQGSRICFSAGKLTDEKGVQVIEGLKTIDFTQDYYAIFNRLPDRDHVRITEKGSADTKGSGKFDEELVPKGTRFVFEVEVAGTEGDEETWSILLQTLHQPFFRIGAGTRNGFGKLTVKSCQTKVFDLQQTTDLLAYLEKDSSLNNEYSAWVDYVYQKEPSTQWIQYEIALNPENYFLFGAGYGDGDADMQPKMERIIDWETTGEACYTDQQERLLIPATSIKGAISHRVAFHYNLLKGRTISNAGEDKQIELPTFDSEQHLTEFFRGCTESELNTLSFEQFLAQPSWSKHKQDLLALQKETQTPKTPTGEDNEAVKTLFGYAKEGQDATNDGARGKVVFSDVYKELIKEDKKMVKEKIFNHVAIDRFTGGGIDGALYKEKVVSCDYFMFDIYVEKSAFEGDHIQAAFENTLQDLITGRLQLGGNTTKGHGVFDGSIKTTISPSLFILKT